MNTITDDTPIVMLTVRQLKDIINGIKQPDISKVEDYTRKRYLFGLKGIRDEFSISHATAQKWKDGILKEAIVQHGRKIITDTEKAYELLNKTRK